LDRDNGQQKLMEFVRFQLALNLKSVEVMKIGEYETTPAEAEIIKQAVRFQAVLVDDISSQAWRGLFGAVSGGFLSTYLRTTHSTPN
jgi:hypothetical protein